MILLYLNIFFRKICNEQYNNIGSQLSKKDKCNICSKFDNIINFNGNSLQNESIINSTTYK